MYTQYQAYNLEEWLAANMHRNYPVVDDTLFQSTTGTPVPSSFLVDLRITTAPLPEADATARFFVSSINRSGTSMDVEISYYPESGSAFVCARSTFIDATLSAGDPVADRTFSLAPTPATIPSTHEQLMVLNGTIIVGTTADVIESYSIDYQNGTILPTCIAVATTGLNGLSAGGSTDLTGTVTIEAGDGIELSVTEAVEGGSVNKTIVITRVPTEEELASEYASFESLYNAILEQLGNPIRSLNGVSPDSSGNIDIVGDDCTTVTAGSHSIALSNPCATPCCADYKTADITTAVSALESAKERLLEYYETLSNNINTMQARLASLIGNS